MRTPNSRLSRLALAATMAGLVGCSETASIQGNLIVGPGHEGQAVFALLFRIDTITEPDPDRPGRERTRRETTFVSPLSVGVAKADGGSFPYLFHSLAAGEWLIGGWLDRHDDRDPTGDVITVDELTVLVLDPADPERRLAKHDLFVGMSGPGRGTLRGMLHRSERARDLPVSVLVLDGPINDPNARAVAAATVDAGLDGAFTAFNVPPGNVHLVALADIGADGKFTNDLIAISAANPVLVDLEDHRVTEGLELWLDRQAPALGSLSGTLTLNAPLPTARYQLAVYNADPRGETAPALLALLNLSPQNATSVPFTVPSLPLGDLYLAGFIETFVKGGTLDTFRIYPGGGADAKGIPLTAEAPHAANLALPMGVGRASGRIRVAGLKHEVTQAAVLAVVRDPTGARDEIRQLEIFPGETSGGVFTSSFDLFGLEDGPFELQLIPDNTGGLEDWIQDRYEQGFVLASTPTEITITGGSREGADFDVTLQP